MDVAGFDLVHEVEDDYNLHDLFPVPVSHSLQQLVEYRIKLLLKNDVKFLSGETQVVNTSCMLKRKMTDGKSMHLLPYENLPLSFESLGYISENFSGRVKLKLTNYNSKSVKLTSGTPVGYLVLQSYSLN